MSGGMFLIAGIEAAIAAVKEGVAINAENRLAVKKAEATQAADKATYLSAIRTVDRINVERSAQYQSIQGALARLQVQKKAAQGQLIANQAASGAVGASTVAALSDTEQKAGIAWAGIQQNRNAFDLQSQWQVEDVTNRATENFHAHALDNVVSAEEAGVRAWAAGDAAFWGGIGGGSAGGNARPSDNTSGGSYTSTDVSQGLQTYQQSFPDYGGQQNSGFGNTFDFQLTDGGGGDSTRGSFGGLSW